MSFEGVEKLNLDTSASLSLKMEQDNKIGYNYVNIRL